MSRIDITRLSRRRLIEHFEHERQEWLKIGMSEADIFRIHFGELSENGRGGDYRMWLDERRHIRSDHKYAVGSPVSYEDSSHGVGFCNGNGEVFAGIEFSADLKKALAALTELQRRYFVLNRIQGYFCSEIGRIDGKDESTIRESLRVADKKIKSFFSSTPE
ncbi:MAG: hypothetical protein FWC20_08800 [Oscillospiraceae bacterium]|nr:hypothetical protein [Oscillospiraceae bacterium]MCL2279487.1 hypothetical protein [Oscillospiraceae bacterium]